MRLRLPQPRGVVLERHQSPANKNTVSFRVCIRSADCSSDLCPFAMLSSSSCPCFRRPRIDGGTCLRSTSLSSDLERHDRCSSASGRPCRLAGGPGVCGGIPTTSEADSCCQAVEGCTTVECEKAAPQPAQAGLQRENSCVNQPWFGSVVPTTQGSAARLPARAGAFADERSIEWKEDSLSGR
jgi:hypothetical protein